MASLRTLGMITLLFGIALSDGCHRPTLDKTELAAIRSGAMRLMRTDASPPDRDPDPDALPEAIRRLQPDHVIVRRNSVDIITKSWFDGGWGYYVTVDRAAPSMPIGCYLPIGDNIYWHNPC